MAGTDPRGALPLVHHLAGRTALFPLREIVIEQGPLADSLRAERVKEYAAYRPRDPAHWRGLVGKEEPPLPEMVPGRKVQLTHKRDPDEAPVLVIIGGDCRSACELTARMLQTYAGASILGRIGWAHRLAHGHIGKLILPASRVEIHVPTSAWVLNPRIRRAGGLAGGWHQAYGAIPAKPYDGLGRALLELRKRLGWRDKERRWESEDPPPCAGFTGFTDRKSLPAGARDRLHGRWREHQRTIEALLYLPPERAVAYVNACPGLQVRQHFAFGFHGLSTWMILQAQDYASLSRLAQCEAVDSIDIEMDHPIQPNAPNAAD